MTGWIAAVAAPQQAPHSNALLRLTYCTAFLLYCLSFGALMFPYFAGDVLAPTRQTAELELNEASPSRLTENRKFNDYVLNFVPELQAQQRTKYESWLATWTTDNQLGRPLYQDYSVWLPTWMLKYLTDDTYRYITVYALANCFVAGMFMFLLLREWGLTPFASLSGAWLFSTLPPFLYWLTFSQFTADLAWAAAIMFAITRLTKRVSLPSWALLVFSAYSLALTAYQQSIVYQIYFLGGWSAYTCYVLWRTKGLRSALKVAACALSALLVSAACVAPVYIDLWETARSSSRFSWDIKNFLSALPDLNSWTSVKAYVSLYSFPEILGNPISPSYPVRYDSDGLPPVFLILVLASLGAALRRTWGWWCAVVVILLFSLASPFYAFGIMHLGFNLSRSPPSGLTLLPFSIIAAVTLDELLKRPCANTTRFSLIGATAAAALLLGVAVSWAGSQNLSVSWLTVALSGIVIGLCLAYSLYPAPILFGAAMALFAIYASRPLLLYQKPEDIRWTSPLVEAIRANLPEGTRYAVVGTPISALEPNVNASLGLPSIHTYNGLMSRGYRAFIEKLGGGFDPLGKANSVIAPKFDLPEFHLANIGLVLSKDPLQHAGLTLTTTVGGIGLYRVDAPMGCCLKMPAPENARAGGIDIDTVARSGEIVKRVDTAGFLELETSPGPAALLVVSQGFHPYWRASVSVGGTWQPATVIPVNEAFTGILLPPKTTRIRLRFEPFVRYAWIAYVLFLVLVALIIILRPGNGKDGPDVEPVS
jgi:hypothetical protein